MANQKILYTLSIPTAKIAVCYLRQPLHSSAKCASATETHSTEAKPALVFALNVRKENKRSNTTALYLSAIQSFYQHCDCKQ